jgi:hypothetical protein
LRNDTFFAMDLARIRHYAHQHCRFKLRSGKEVFGVIWEVETTDGGGSRDGGKLLFFASVHDYERLKREGTPVHVIPMRPEEIVAVESLAS